MKYLLIDRILDLQKEEFIRTEKRFGIEEEFFRDHFPENPVVPGALLLECAAQSAGWLIQYSLNFEFKSVLIMADEVQFRHFAKPGELLEMHSRIASLKSSTARTENTIAVNGQHVASMILTHAFPFRLTNNAYPIDPLQHWMLQNFDRMGGIDLLQKRNELPCPALQAYLEAKST